MIGRVAPTGKLQLYLAARQFVLASRVGESSPGAAADVVEVAGRHVDPNYPARLADRVAELGAGSPRDGLFGPAGIGCPGPTTFRV